MAKHFNIADMYEMVADKVPARTALVCGEQRASYAELDERANRLAHYLAAQEVGAGDHVGLYLYNCNEYLEAMLACFKQGSPASRKFAALCTMSRAASSCVAISASRNATA